PGQVEKPRLQSGLNPCSRGSAPRTDATAVRATSEVVPNGIGLDAPDGRKTRSPSPSITSAAVAASIGSAVSPGDDGSAGRDGSADVALSPSTRAASGCGSHPPIRQAVSNR